MINAGYVWREGFPVRADANAFAEQLRELQREDGAINVEDVLDANRPAGAPLHDSIIWDDQEAAIRYRLDYVRDAMGALRVIPVDIVREEPLSPVRAVLPIRGGDADQDRGGSVYRFTVATVKAQDETQFHAQVRQDAIDQIGRMARRLSSVPGCQDIAERLLGILGIL